MVFVELYIYLPESLTFCLIFAGVKRLTFASKDAERKQSLGGTMLENDIGDHTSHIQIPLSIQRIFLLNKLPPKVIDILLSIGHPSYCKNKACRIKQEFQNNFKLTDQHVYEYSVTALKIQVNVFCNIMVVDKPEFLGLYNI